ncbi:N-6 DNA methylase [Planomonospora sp. ID91781]|uniref:Eco57I restriction-modification methylase domain-containing protein n=1 Tax=Planomonospora sp. ID91781 TaxID=2738135 RepID=UPI0018C3BD0B|nr:DNA methyltransferase [Planomonospora sp. ID91781]MBG0824922.1 N-6 DNA methylase [Planomonospora sp. ID91781]
MSRSPFPSLRVAGGLLPADLFTRALEDKDLPGREAAAYGLAPHENVREAASRAWDYLGGAWKAFTRERDRAVAEGRPLTGLTRERWLLTLFRALDYGVLSGTPAGGLTVEDKTFKVSHRWEHVPIHLLGWAVDLDHRTKGVAGAADAAPQSMLQELLNRCDDHLWAILSNGAKLRLIRDSRSLAGSAYVEFDLELIFDEQLFSDFMLLFRLVHASRFAVKPDEQPSSCWLEKWRGTVIQQGQRVKERLRGGVEQAINTFGTGFLRHPANSALREQLASGTLKLRDYQRSVLRLAYRMLFWMVTEDRDVLLDPSVPAAARERYLRFFSAERLRERARRGGVDHHDDLWETVRLVFVALGTESGLPELALPGIGGLFERITRDESGEVLDPSRPDELDEPLEGLRLTNQALITAVRHLAIAESDGQRRPVDFRNLGSEELGSVYESLLELHPRYDPAEQTYTLTTAAGNERKTTGSYYTPPSLTGALLDSTLDPLLDEAARTAGDAAAKVEALLSITVCDPACGSGHFLVAAARRIAGRVAEIRSGEDEPSPDLVRTAMREVVARCIHGVDINEMAAELAKVSLWLESVEPGKPLAFLDTNIRVGNTLLGATPALIEKGVPKDAFKPIEGDDKKIAALIAKKHAKEAVGIIDFYAAGALTNAEIGRETAELVRALPGDLTGALVQRRRLRDIDAERLPLKRKADAWCAAFVQEKTAETEPLAITGSTLDWISGDPSEWTSHHKAVAKRVKDLTEEYRFFHWHVEFPHIFAIPEDNTDVDPMTGWSGGFTCVIGNPPWERISVEDEEFFAVRAPEILNNPTTATRKSAIRQLEETEPNIFNEYQRARRYATSVSHFTTASGKFENTAVGRLTTQSLFASIGLTILKRNGLCGLILPTGVVTDTPMKNFWRWLVANRRITALLDFENKGIFPIHANTKFSIINFVGPLRAADQLKLTVGTYLRDVSEIKDPNRVYTFPLGKLDILSPKTHQLPICRTQKDIDVLLRVVDGGYERLEIIPWVGFTSEGHSKEWREEPDLNTFPLYEGKMINQFDSCFATYLNVSDSDRRAGRPRNTTAQEKALQPTPRFYAPATLVRHFLARKQTQQEWVCVVRDYARAVDTRTAIGTIVPTTVPIQPLNGYTVIGDALTNAWATAAINSFTYDFIARQKVPGMHFNVTIMSQIPVPSPNEKWFEFVTSRAVELIYTQTGLKKLAEEAGISGPPFTWDDQRRSIIRAELDAAFMHIYGVGRDDAEYILDSFSSIRNSEKQKFGEFLTKRIIMDIYDSLADPGSYQTILNPPPGHGPRHPTRTNA